MNLLVFRPRPNFLYRIVKPIISNNPSTSLFKSRRTSISYFGTSATRAMAQDYKLKGVTSLDLKPGAKQEVEVEGLDAKVLLVNAGGKVQALGPKCTHYGAPLVNGVLTTNGRLTCPWHGGELCSAYAKQSLD
jgi:nitrite reductase/ring-hydroxylating ferredoxin subunit